MEWQLPAELENTEYGGLLDDALGAARALEDKFEALRADLARLQTLPPRTSGQRAPLTLQLEAACRVQQASTQLSDAVEALQQLTRDQLNARCTCGQCKGSCWSLRTWQQIKTAANTLVDVLEWPRGLHNDALKIRFFDDAEYAGLDRETWDYFIRPEYEVPNYAEVPFCQYKSFWVCTRLVVRALAAVMAQDELPSHDAVVTMIKTMHKSMSEEYSLRALVDGAGGSKPLEPGSVLMCVLRYARNKVPIQEALPACAQDGDFKKIIHRMGWDTPGQYGGGWSALE